MKNYVAVWYQTVLRALFQDTLNLVFLTANVVLVAVNYFIWNWKLESPELYAVSIGRIFPVEYLFVILVINLFLAVFSYDKEKEIGYLLLGANLFVGILTVILEFFYLISSHA